jgi:hypothetical protein
MGLLKVKSVSVGNVCEYNTQTHTDSHRQTYTQTDRQTHTHFNNIPEPLAPRRAIPEVGPPGNVIYSKMKKEKKTGKIGPGFVFDIAKR